MAFYGDGDAAAGPPRYTDFDRKTSYFYDIPCDIDKIRSILSLVLDTDPQYLDNLRIIEPNDLTRCGYCNKFFSRDSCPIKLNPYAGGTYHLDCYIDLLIVQLNNGLWDFIDDDEEVKKMKKMKIDLLESYKIYESDIAGGLPEVVDDNAVGMGRFSTKKSKLHIPFVYGPKKINKFKRRTKFNKKRDSKLNYKDYEAIKNLDLDDEYAEMLNKWLSELQ